MFATLHLLVILCHSGIMMVINADMIEKQTADESCPASFKTPPNVVLVMADDLGWSDVGFTHKPVEQDSEIGVPETPNLDRMSSEGLILDNLYTQAACTPTRGSLMTGKYAFRLGQLFSSSIMRATEQQGSSSRYLSEELFDRGYKVHGVGKWHLGHASKQHRPTERGFNSFYGIYNGMGTFYSHLHVGHPWKGSGWGEVYGEHDFHYDYRNKTETPNPSTSPSLTPTASVFTETTDDVGVHATELFTRAVVTRIQEHDTTSPLFLYVAYTAPHSPLKPEQSIVEGRNSHIRDTERRKYAAMVTQMDDGFGRIVAALEKRNMKDNTVIIFLSDHGAALVRSCWDYVGGSNLPYRDGKFTFFEGGIKSPAFVWTPGISEGVRGTRSNALLHVVDVYTYVLSLSALTEGCSSRSLKEDEVQDKIDGGDYLTRALKGDHSGRDTILHNLVSTPLPPDKQTKYCSPTQPHPGNYGVIRHGKYKLFYGELVEWCYSDVLTEPCPDLLIINNHNANIFNNIDVNILDNISTLKDVNNVNNVKNKDLSNVKNVKINKENVTRTGIMLFDLESDPFERVNIASSNTEVVGMLLGLLSEYAQEAPTQWVV